MAMGDVLIVEDVSEVRMLFEFALSDAGHTVRTAASGTVALA